MPLTDPLPRAPLALPTREAIQAAIAAADERARLLRQLLRLSAKLEGHLTPAEAAEPTEGTPCDGP